MPANTALPGSISTKSKSSASRMPGLRPEDITARSCANPSRPAPTSSTRLMRFPPLPGQMPASPISRTASGDRLEGECDTLTTADTERNNSALEPVSPHRVDQAGRQDGAGSADGMPVGDSTTLDIDNVLRQPELA